MDHWNQESWALSFASSLLMSAAWVKPYDRNQEDTVS